MTREIDRYINERQDIDRAMSARAMRLGAA